MKLCKASALFIRRWGGWAYEGPHGCTKARVCRVCEFPDPHRLQDQHDWKYSSPGERRQCAHCGKKQEKRTWTETVQVGYSDPGSGYAEETFTEWHDVDD